MSNYDFTPQSVTPDEKTMAMLAHLLGILTGFLAPLIIFLFKKDSSKFVAFHSLEQLYFQIAVWVSYAIAGILCFVLIGFLLLPIVGLLHVVFCIIAAVRANQGDWYEIPLVGAWAKSSLGL